MTDNASPNRTRRKRPGHAPASAVRPPATSPDPGGEHVGLRPSTTSENAFSLIALRCLESMVAHQEATARGEPSALHQMRIAITCLRTAVRFFSPMVSGDQWDSIKAELKWLNSHLGVARDLDVLMDDVGARGAARHSARKLDDKWSAAHARVTKAIQSARYRRLIRSGADWIRLGDWRNSVGSAQNPIRSIPISAYASLRLQRWQRRILRKSRDLAAMDADTRHRLRIRTKRIRYAMEWFGQFLPDSTPEQQRATLKQLRRAQKCLGELNDAERARTLAGRRPSVPDKRDRRLLRTAQSAFELLAEQASSARAQPRPARGSDVRPLNSAAVPMQKASTSVRKSFGNA